MRRALLPGPLPGPHDIPDWLRLTTEGRLREAYEIAQAANNFPEFTGRVCPQDRLCEGNCVIEQAGHGTVTIGSVERFLADTAWEQGWVAPIRPARERPESVGILGAGPAGLACADSLRRAGVRSRSTTATTARAGSSPTASPASSSRRTW
jgi:glutamate synthase (NADPH/NADH) small chain